MRHFVPKLTLALLTALALVACGGGGGGGGGSDGGGGNNAPPTAHAGANQTVNANVTVTLNGTSSADSDGTIATYAWTQTAGTAVTLTAATSSQPTFVAPDVSVATTLTFSLIVTDNKFAPSSAATVNILVNPAPNAAPTANAGPDQTSTSGFIVTLNGAASSDTDGTIGSYAWTVTAGTPAATLIDATTAAPSFVAPTVGTATTYTFSLIVTDNRGASSTADTVSVVVDPQPAGTTIISGAITFTRIPTTRNGLDYGAPRTQPARGVLVRARNTTSQAIVATTSTSNTGGYSLSVANGLPIRIEAVSQMTRSGALPNWDFRVQDGITGNNPYVFTDNLSFNSSTGGVHDLLIPSGFNASGAVTGTRASAPFAILDTLYQGMQTILAVEPTTNFPTLTVDWEASNPAGETYFTTETSGGNRIQYMVLSADAVRDTDEFDQHVIAHEFGHYIEFNYSRADNIGGAHSIGDKLDIRTAFGEGFGYAFAAIVLKDPVALDTAFNAQGRGISTVFEIEDNPPAPDDPNGCWCSESSVWSILWDLYDPGSEAGDTVALGFAPLWSVLTSAQRNTPAATSIFSFITALKLASPAAASQIDTLVAAQNITSATIDAFATTETLFPAPVPAVGALPVYTNASVGGGAVIVQSVNNAGTGNKLGNHRLVRFTVPAPGQQVTIRVTTSNTNPDADPDFDLFRNGAIIARGVSTVLGSEQVVVTLSPATYVLDVYDCGNVCTDENNQLTGTPGSYALTVTIN